MAALVISSIWPDRTCGPERDRTQFGGLLAHTLLGWLRGLPAEMDAQKTFELVFAAFLAFLVAWPGRRFICRLIRKAEARRPSSELGVAMEAALLAIVGGAHLDSPCRAG
jgi:hypothetical protein